MAKRIIFVVLLLVILAAVYGVLQFDQFHGLLLLAIAVLPLATAILAGFSVKRMLPDITLGFVDAGLLTIAAGLGAVGFGVSGAIVAAVIADSLVDILVGKIDEPLKQWYRKRHIDEVHSKWGHSYAKMIGCFLGTGLMLTIAGAIGISPWSMFR